MSDAPTTQVGRLAMRVEGIWWRAYYARPDSMDEAILLGCIHMKCVEESPVTKQQFMDTMKTAVAVMLKGATGCDVAKWDVQRGPEHERSGRA